LHGSHHSISIPQSSWTPLGRPIVFSGDKVPEPSQERIRRDNSSELFEGLRSQCLGFHCQSTPLFIGESEPAAFEMFLIYPDLFEKIVDDFLLIPVDPAGYKQDEES
jgi:hypothetical protein